MEGSAKNSFDKRGGELMPRELMERVADPALVPDEALVAVLLKTVLTPGDDKGNLYALLLNDKNARSTNPYSNERGSDARSRRFRTLCLLP